MRSYGQYCPIARASEIFAERWTPIIVRNILLGADTFNAIAAGAPGISRTLLSQRLGELERLELVRREPAPSGKSTRYLPTPAGAELWDVCLALGNWGARWLEVGPRHVDPYVVLWSMCKSFDHARLPDKRTVVRLEFPAVKGKPRFWLIFEHRTAEVCIKPPGDEEALVIAADAEAFALWHMGRLAWADAVRQQRIKITGPRALARAFPTWNRLSTFASVQPASQAS